MKTDSTSTGAALPRFLPTLLAAAAGLVTVALLAGPAAADNHFHALEAWNNHYGDGLFVRWSDPITPNPPGPVSGYTIHTDADCSTPAISTGGQQHWFPGRPEIRDITMSNWGAVNPNQDYYLRIAPSTERRSSDFVVNELQCFLFRAELRAAIAGRVTDAQTFAGIPGATVTAYNSAGEVAGQQTTVSSVPAGQESHIGNYSIDGLPPGTYTVTAEAEGYQPMTRTVQASEGLNGGVTFALQPAPAADPSLEFVPISPCAVFDSRTGSGAFAGTLAGGASRTLQVTGGVPATQGGAACTAPPADAVAVKINLVALDAEGAGNLRIAEAGVTPEGGVVNFTPGFDNSNALSVRVDGNGRVAVSNVSGGGSVHIRGVVLGYYTDTDAAGLEFVETTPCAVFDSRADTATGGFAGRLAAGTTRTLQVTGDVPTTQGGADCDAPPADAVAVEINLVAISPTGPGNLRIAEAGVTPSGGVVNFTPGMNNSNALPVEVSSAGQVAVTNNVGGGAVHVRGVVLGYYTDTNDTGLEFFPVSPCAVFDTRTGDGAFAGRVAGGDSRTLQVTGDVPATQGGTTCDAPPADAVAVEVNLVGAGALGAGNLQIAAAGVTPSGGVVNFSPGANNSNALPVGVDNTGQVTVTNTEGGGAVHIRGVILGYYVEASPPAPAATFEETPSR